MRRLSVDARVMTGVQQDEPVTEKLRKLRVRRRAALGRRDVARMVMVDGCHNLAIYMPGGSGSRDSRSWSLGAWTRWCCWGMHPQRGYAARRCRSRRWSHLDRDHASIGSRRHGVGGCGFGGGQANGDGRTSTLHGRGINAAIVFSDNLGAGRQAKTGAFASPLGREEWLEDAL